MKPAYWSAEAGGDGVLPASKTMLSVYQDCPRAAYYKYCEGLRTKGVIQRLERGSAYGLGVESWWLAAGELTPRLFPASAAMRSSEYYTKLNQENQLLTEAMLQVYDEVYAGCTPPAVDSEVLLVGPLTSSSCSWAKVDLVVEPLDKPPVLVEIKTTEQDITEESWYWEKLRYDLQLGAYWNAYPGFRIVWDVTKVPNLRMENATPPDRQEFYVRGSKDGKHGPGAPKPGTRLHDESSPEFRARAVAYLRDHRYSHYRRQEIRVTEAQKAEVVENFRQWAALLENSAATGIWPRKNSSCRRGKSLCDYYSLCFRDDSVPEAVVRNLFKVKDTNNAD